jgi:hypothetical protein
MVESLMSILGKTWLAVLFFGVALSLLVNIEKQRHDRDGIGSKEALAASVQEYLPARGEIGFVAEKLTHGDIMGYQYALLLRKLICFKPGEPVSRTSCIVLHAPGILPTLTTHPSAPPTSWQIVTISDTLCVYRPEG